MKTSTPKHLSSGNVLQNFKKIEMRFNDYCIQSNYRNLEKNPNTEGEEHYKMPLLEISALRSVMPDEVLKVIRYTIDPQIIPAVKRNHGYGWRILYALHRHIRFHPLTVVNVGMFAHTETIQDWEVRIRQAGSLCEYGNLLMSCVEINLFFGLSDTIICINLLKTYLRTDCSQKNMPDIIVEEKRMESAQNKSKLITDIAKSIEETVHWTALTRLKKRHNEMKPKREQNTCQWCRDPRGLHPWSDCPTKGRKCHRCGGNDHFPQDLPCTTHW